MKYDKLEEKEKLNKTNEELIRFMRDYPKEGIQLTAIGNSISDGFSFSEPGRLLLDRNLGLIEVGEKNGIKVKKNHLSRSENNNSLAVANWIRNNYTEHDSYNWNKEDYKRAIEKGKPLLNEEEIDMYFSNGSNEKIQDIILNSNSKIANIVILNLGTGSFLDILTRHGSLTIPNIFNSLQRDIRGISEILELIQNNNRENNSHTQVYLCGAPRIMNTIITDLAMNHSIKKIGSEYANVTYVPSFPRQAFYKTANGSILPDPHYNHAEYYHFLNDIENHIINSYLVRDLMIDMDTILYKLSEENDIKGANNSSSDALDIIKDIAKKYEDKDGDYNYFLDLAKMYIKRRYSFDFYMLSPEENLGNSVDSLKRKK
ncbi:MAG: hypothetical protein J6J17_01220 [Bacilli bacterium]|nr:hypothetical protein [Bacilli bacterium]